MLPVMTQPRDPVAVRLGAVLRALAAEEPDGGTTAGLARRAGLARPTAHRLLTTLAEQGLVDRTAASGRWHLGPELYLLGQAAAPRYDVTDAAREIVSELASETGESAFFSIRRGDETVCLVREDGSFPLRSHVLHEGVRFPLGVASAGLVILAHLPDRDVDDYLSRVDLGAAWGAGHERSPLEARVAETRRDGYATNPGLVVEGSWGMGAAVFDALGSPRWALSLTGVESRFRSERRAELGTLLLDQAHRLGRRLARRDT